MKEVRLTVSGFGGQGVMALGQVLTAAALREEKQVIWVPSYGPEMRGGTANCSVIISDKRIGSPVVNKSDISIVFNEPSYNEFEKMVKPGGILIVNSSLIKLPSNREDIEYRYIPVNDIAKDLGNERTLNMVMLGYLLQSLDDLKVESIKDGFTEVFGDKSKKIWPINEEAIIKGFNY